MIEVTVKSGDAELAHIRIENVTATKTDHGDYSIQFGVWTGAGQAVYQRKVENFPRKKFNVLGLLRFALTTLEEKELSLDADPDAASSSNLARRLPRSLWPF